jgi:CHAD domain-containing protein
MIPITPWLRHLRRHVPVARAGRDPEGVHQVRAGAARLAAWLDLSGTRVLKDDLRWMRRRASTVRDLDVLLMRRLPRAFREHLLARRRAARADLLAALGDPRSRDLLHVLALLPPLRRGTARRNLRRLDRRARRALARVEAEGRRARAETLHDLRRAVRRLRHAREWLHEDAAPLREVQLALGALNDVVVARRWLARFPGRAAHAPLFARWLAEERRARAAALRACGQLREQVERRRT